MSDKIKIHIRNNHWKTGFLPCDFEGEKNHPFGFPVSRYLNH